MCNKTDAARYLLMLLTLVVVTVPLTATRTWAQADITEPTNTPANPVDLAATSSAALSDTAMSEADDYTFLEQQIYSGEAATAQRSLETIVTQVTATRHRYHEALLEPLTLLGDAHMVQGQFETALEHYDRARHIARVSYGLFDEHQLPVVYREAEAFRRAGDWASAIKREEYAYEVALKAYGDYDPQLLPGLMRLGKFYLETHNYFSARVMFNQAMNVHAKNGSAFSLDAIPALQGIALSHRLERFPPFYIANTDDNRIMGPAPESSALDGQQIVFNNFPAGEKALQQIIEIRRRQEPQDLTEIYTAMVELADWHLLFGRSNTANTLYGHVYKQMAEGGQDPQSFFGEPEMLYWPKPSNPKQPKTSMPANAVTGRVTLKFDIAPSGRVRNMQTVDSQPPKLMDYRVRRSMRLAVYRPKLESAVAITVQDHTFTHNFNYYPKVDPALTSATPITDTDTDTDTGSEVESMANAGEIEE